MCLKSGYTKYVRFSFQKEAKLDDDIYDSRKVNHNLFHNIENPNNTFL